MRGRPPANPADATRREFVACALAGIATPLLESCAFMGPRASDLRYQAIFDVSSLAADRQSLVAPTPGPDRAAILVVRQKAHRFLALSLQCTHEGCPVRPPVEGLIVCPCHGSAFDLDGKVRRGPARFPLARYATEYNAKEKSVRVSAR